MQIALICALAGGLRIVSAQLKGKVIALIGLTRFADSLINKPIYQLARVCKIICLRIILYDYIILPLFEPFTYIRSQLVLV